jgi:hypothetical protein
MADGQLVHSVDDATDWAGQPAGEIEAFADYGAAANACGLSTLSQIAAASMTTVKSATPPGDDDSDHGRTLD